MTRNTTVSLPWILALLALGSGMIGCRVLQAQIRMIPWHDLRTGDAGAELLATGDFDNSGTLDLAFVIPESNRVLRFVFNNGNGTFEYYASDIEVHPGRPWMKAADFDQNRTTDLIWISNYSSPSLLNIYYNDGDGRTGRTASFEASDNRASDMTLTDFDGDGAIDCLIVDGEPEGSGSFVRGFRNVNGELVNRIEIRLPYPEGRSIASGDWNGDGYQDIATVSIDRRWIQYEGWVVFGAELTILLNDGHGSLQIEQRIALPYEFEALNRPSGLGVGDLDGDGDNDLVVEVSGAEFILIEQNNNGQFVAGEPFRLGVDDNGARPSNVGVADLDTDGDLDFIYLGEGTIFRKMWILENRGNMSFRPIELWPGSQPSSIYVLGDFSGDGRIDLAIPGIVRSSGRGKIALYKNISAILGPTLDHTPLKRGHQASLIVSGAIPGETVYFISSFSGLGNSLGQRALGGITLDLLDPIIIIGRATTNADGIASIHGTIPGQVPLTDIALQAVARRGPNGGRSVKTPFRWTRITD